MRRQVLLTVNKVPGSGPNLSAVLRTAVGLSTAYEPHRVEVVLLGEGVVCALKATNQDWVRRYQKAAKAHKIRVYVEASSLEARKIEADQLAADVEPLDRAAFLAKWTESDLQMRM